MRFDGKAYPQGMCEFPFRLRGQGFFPGGDGLWRSESELGSSKSGPLPKAGAMFVGNDFGTLSGFIKLRAKNYENVPTWRHIKARIRAANIPTESTFFTNAIVGLRQDGTALDKRSWESMPDFAKFCGEFLRFQLEVLSPRLVVVMGPDARVAFDTFARQACIGQILYTSHPYADFGLTVERRANDIAALAESWNSCMPTAQH